MGDRLPSIIKIKYPNKPTNIMIVIENLVSLAKIIDIFINKKKCILKTTIVFITK